MKPSDARVNCDSIASEGRPARYGTAEYHILPPPDFGCADASVFQLSPAVAVLAENNTMLEVFRDSGFDVRSTVERCAVTVILSLPVQLRALEPLER